MNFGELDTFIRAIIPAATKVRFTPELMLTVTNKAKDDISARLMLYKKYKEFTITAGQQTYNFSEMLDDYLIIDESGVWYKDSNSKWEDIDAYSRKRLDVDYPDWRNNGSSSPERYFIEADLLVLDPKPSESTTGRIYYCAKPLDMVENDDYPFHKLNDQKKEIPQFSILDECIWAYAEWWVSKIESKDEDARILSKRSHYTTLIEEKRQILYGRPDILTSEDMLMRGPYPI